MHILYVDESGDDGFSKDNEYRPGLTPTKYFIRNRDRRGKEKEDIAGRPAP